MVEISPLTRLVNTLKEVRFIFPTADFTQADQLRSRVIHKLDNQVLPRLRNLEAPLICVLAGSTGSGKSTLVNSLLQADVATASAVRPTTRRPLLLHSPLDAQWFAGDDILPQLAKVRVASNDPATPVNVGTHSEVEIRAHEALPPGLALLDAPDFDSIAEDNRKLARQLLDVADMWIFVTTATRYADALPWEVLREAKARNITLSVVLNRTPLAAMDEIKTDLQRLLTEAGLGGLPLLGIAERQLENGRIPQAEVAPLLGWMHSYAENAQVRVATAMRSLLGTSRLLVGDSQQLLQAVDRQFLLVTDAQTVVESQQRLALERVAAASADGSLLKGEVLARWQQLVGVSELTQQIERGFNLFKFRLKSFFTGQKPEVASLEVALESGLQTIISAELFAAETAVRRAWAADVHMRGFEAQLPRFSAEQVGEEVRAVTVSWQHKLLEIIRSEGGSKRTSARVMAAGVNLLGVALMIVIFASTGGLTGAELGVAGTTSVVAQKLLEVIFGDQAVKSMTAKAHKLLIDEVSALYTKQFADLHAAIPMVADPVKLAGVVKDAEETINELDAEVRQRLGDALQ